MENTIVMPEGFSELSDFNLAIINGGGLLAIIAGGVVSYIVYECANAVCEDLTGKTVGKHLADWLFPA